MNTCLHMIFTEIIGGNKAGLGLEHEEAPAQELSGNTLRRLEWRDELAGVRRGEYTEMGARCWEEDLLVHSARRKICSMPASRCGWGSTSSRVCGRWKNTCAKTSPDCPPSQRRRKEKHPFLLLASNCNRVPQKSSRGEKTHRPSPAGPHP